MGKLDTCVCCGKYVPEGRQICAFCEADIYKAKKEFERNNIDCSVTTMLEVQAIIKSMRKGETDDGSKD